MKNNMTYWLIRRQISRKVRSNLARINENGFVVRSYRFCNWLIKSAYPDAVLNRTRIGSQFAFLKTDVWTSNNRLDAKSNYAIVPEIKGFLRKNCADTLRNYCSLWVVRTGAQISSTNRLGWWKKCCFIRRQWRSYLWDKSALFSQSFKSVYSAFYVWKSYNISGITVIVIIVYVE